MVLVVLIGPVGLVAAGSSPDDLLLAKCRLKWFLPQAFDGNVLMKCALYFHLLPSPDVLFVTRAVAEAYQHKPT